MDCQNEQLLAELNHCRKNNEHPDIEEQLISAEIEEMLWLSPDAIFTTQDKETQDEDKDKDIGDIVPYTAGLKRSSKPRTASNILKTTRDSENSTESEL